MKNVHRATQFVAAIAFASAVTAAQALPQRLAATPSEALGQLGSNTGGALSSNVRNEDAYAAVYAGPGALLLSDGAAASPLERAQNFLGLYGALQGVTDAQSQLKVNRISRDRAGITHVHLDQVQNGLPVFGARLVVHMNALGITGVNGVFIPGLEGLSAVPAMSVDALRDRGMLAARKLHPKADLTIESTRALYYNTGLLLSLPGSNRLAYEVMISDPASGVREQIILDADKGTLLNRIDRIESTLNRKIYTPVLVNPATNAEASPVLTEKGTASPADPAFTGDTKGNPASSRTHGPGTEPLENLYIYAGGTWQMYKNLFGRDGYDFCDGTGKCTEAAKQVQKSVYLANNQCPNAYWDGTSTNYCPGFDADDVVSHEWSHAYTEYTAGLVYQYQSGALNEAYSDIFGETYDLIDGFEGPIGVSLAEGKYYSDRGSRWVVGEDLSEAAAQVLLRDMWDPDSFAVRVNSPTTGAALVNRKSPGSVITSDNYYCGTGDNGGVHFNSGVANHAYAMLVDGKTFNGVTVPGIGLTKAAQIYFQAHSQYETPTSNFIAHADALERSCADLTGKPLNDIFGKPSTEVVSAADCQAVTKVIAAVEFRGKPGGKPATVAEKCKYVAILKPENTTPAACGAGLFANQTFSEGFDAGAALPSGWTQGKKLVSTFDIPPWTTTTLLPSPHSGRAAFFGNAGEGDCSTKDASASHYLDTPTIVASTGQDYFRFTHFMQSEASFDGGNLKVSVNDGAFVIVPTAAFVYNGHSGAFSAAMGPTTPTGNNTSPNAGQAAWTGSDQGEATGSWGTTVVDFSKLTTPAPAGAKVKFRFDFANDGCGGNLGWFVEDVVAYACKATPPPNSLPVASLTLDKTMGAAPLVVKITAGGSDADSLNGDKVVSYSLSYGDGSASSNENYAAPSSSSSITRSHTFNAAGTYTVVLSVKDSTGAASRDVTQKVTVTGTAPAPTPTPTPAPVPVVTPAAGPAAVGEGRFGGALGLLALLPLLAGAMRRRRQS